MSFEENVHNDEIGEGPIGAITDIPSSSAASWYTSAGNLLQRIGLMIAIIADAGSHTYGYNASGQRTTDAWTLFGTLRTKTYTYNADGTMATKSDWV